MNLVAEHTPDTGAESYLARLNPAQRNAVVHGIGNDEMAPLLVIAGAGSGKTNTLAHRVAHIIGQGTDPCTVLLLTFSRRAADEMARRAERIVRQLAADHPRLAGAKLTWTGTFHSIGARLLREYAGRIGLDAGFTIHDRGDSADLMNLVRHELGASGKAKRFPMKGTCLAIYSATVNTMLPLEEVLQHRFTWCAEWHDELKQLFLAYVEAKQKQHVLDYDDLLLYWAQMVAEPVLAAEMGARFNHILVDEYQDTNALQASILLALKPDGRGLTVVGDDAQSIYAFRGATVRNILDFPSQFAPPANIVTLEQNYRSTQTIVNAANSVIKKNRGQISKEVFSKNEKGEPIKVVKASDDREEGFIVAGHISDLRFREQLEFKDFAILYRTNAQSRIFEESLRRMNIPYKVYGSLSFYQRKEIKDLLAYYRITVNPRDDESLKRIINYPLRGIGKTTIDRLNDYAEKLDTPIWDVLTHLDQVNLDFNKGTLHKLQTFARMIKSFRQRLQEMEAFDLAYTIASETGIIRELQSDKTPENVSRYENIEELLNGIKVYTEDPEREGEKSLSNYLQEVTLMTDADQEKEEDQNRVTIMTIHSAKGLEFKHLVIAGVEEELFPSQMSTDNPKDLEEERRLFYVALTRAEKSAIITYAAQRYKWGIQNACSPSRFIKEIDARFLDLPPDFYPVIQDRGGVQAENEKYVPESYRRLMEQRKQPSQIQSGGRKLVNINQATSKPVQPPRDFIPSDPGMIKEGSRVEHPRFGIGKVAQLEGTGSNIKATVLFPIGTKQLLLKFAKLRVVD